MSKLKKRSGGRTISKVKRNNQRKNKLIKKGKLKPNSQNTWIKAQQEKHQQVKAKKRLREKVAPISNVDQSDDSEMDEDMMDPEDALFLTGIKRGHGDNMLNGMEFQAKERYKKENENKKEQRSLLPIKTKKGIILRSEDVDENGMDSDEEEINENDMNGIQEEHEDEVNPEDFDLNEFKVEVGFMASNFLENPEEKMPTLDRLIQIMSQHSYIPAGFKIASATVNELLKDIIPSYKISHHAIDDSTMQKKSTLKLQGYEKTLLNSAKSHLTKLERHVKKLANRPNDTIGIHSLKCICDILVTHPQFNYSPNIIKLVIPSLDSRSKEVSRIVQDCFGQLFKNDKRGDISLIAVRNIKGYVKSKKYRCRSAVLDCMLSLNLSYLDLKNFEEDKSGKKKNKKQEMLSKKEKKRQKQLQKVEKEMLEAKGEESKAVRNKNFTEVAKILFEMLFRIIKSTEEHNSSKHLLPPALRCISKFCHAINVDFFDDLLRVLSHLLKEDKKMKVPERLLCVKTAFDILTGPGEFLTYDPGYFIKVLYELLPDIDLNTTGQSSLICSILRSMLIKRKKHASKNLVHVFSKALTLCALQTSTEDSIEYLNTLASIKACHLMTFESILESEEDAIPVKVSNFGFKEKVEVGSNSLWELNILMQHNDKEVRQLSKKLSLISNT